MIHTLNSVLFLVLCFHGSLTFNLREKGTESVIRQINVTRTVIIGTHQFSTSNISNSDLQYKDKVAVVTGAGGGDTVEFA